MYIALLKEIAQLTKEIQENKANQQNIQYNTQLQIQYDNVTKHASNLEVELKAKVTSINEQNKKIEQLESLIKELQIAHKYKIVEMEQTVQKVTNELNEYKKRDGVLVQSVESGKSYIYT